jgi:hypothetical protein
MSTDDGMFLPFTFPKPNMVVSPGSTVYIKNLQSVEGQALNGESGIARHLFFSGNDARWSVELKDGKRLKIRIQNLEVRDEEQFVLFCDVTIPGVDIVQAGTIRGKPAIMIFDDPNRDRFDIESLREKFLLMGVTERLLSVPPFLGDTKIPTAE